MQPWRPIREHLPACRSRFMRVSAGLAAAAFAASAAAPALAQYPVKPVRVIIPHAAAGSVDAVGRLVLNRMAGPMNANFVVENRPGAAGSIGADVVARAAPDGYTLMVHSATHVANVVTYKALPYDPFTDFTPIAQLSTQPAILVVHPSLPVRNVKEFLALARARPAQITYASSGQGSSNHLSMERLLGQAKIKLTHVPFRGGPPSIASLLSGETQAVMATISNVVGMVQQGKLRALGVTTPARIRALPDVPTIAESVPGFEWTPYIAMFGPAKLPRELVDRLSGEAGRTLKDVDLVKMLEQQGVEPQFAGPEEMARRMKSDLAMYTGLIRGLGIKPE
jgi:tripartite-type tricarboxylate transporter receptor subunit TctC